MVLPRVIFFLKYIDDQNFHLECLDTLPKIEVFRKMGIKIIGLLNVNESAENFMRISEQATLRQKFVNSVFKIIDDVQLDGVYLTWYWPGCPRVQ